MRNCCCSLFTLLLILLFLLHLITSTTTPTLSSFFRFVFSFVFTLFHSVRSGSTHGTPTNEKEGGDLYPYYYDIEPRRLPPRFYNVAIMSEYPVEKESKSNVTFSLDENFLQDDHP